MSHSGDRVLTNQRVTSQIKDIRIENYLSRGGKVCVSIVFDRLKDARTFEKWLIERKELNQIKNDILDLKCCERARKQLK